VKITEIELRFVKSFLIETEEGNILVDSGTPESGEKLIPYLKNVRYVIFTHSHADHIGGASEIMNRTDAKFGIHKNGEEYLKKGLVRKPVVHSVGLKIASVFFPLLSRGLKPARVDFYLEDGQEIVKGVKVLYTPGHTNDSISIFVEPLNSVIVGDMLQGKDEKLVYPSIYENLEELMKSVQKILDLKPSFIYVSHGKSNSANKVEV